VAVTDGAKQVEQLPVEGLVPYAQNAKIHDEVQVHAIARSIERFGFNNPVLVDKQGVLLAGHGRLLAASELGMKTVPVVRLDHLSEGQAKAYRLADNRLAELSGWDYSRVTEEFLDLQEEGIDFTELGWQGHELEILLQADFSPDEKTDLPDKDEGSAHVVSFSADQWSTVKDMLTSFQLVHQQKLSHAEALTQLCAEWGNQKTK
jgi:hypothetical protein